MPSCSSSEGIGSYWSLAQSIKFEPMVHYCKPLIQFLGINLKMIQWSKNFRLKYCTFAQNNCPKTKKWPEILTQRKKRARGAKVF